MPMIGHFGGRQGYTGNKNIHLFYSKVECQTKEIFYCKLGSYLQNRMKTNFILKLMANMIHNL